MRAPDYQRDGVSLYCGDCLEILPELDAGSIELDRHYFDVAVNRIEAEFNRHPLFDQPAQAEIQPTLIAC